MATFKITGRDTELGSFEGATARDAAEAMARDAGYSSLAESAAALGQTEDEALAELKIVEATPIG